MSILSNSKNYIHISDINDIDKSLDRNIKSALKNIKTSPSLFPYKVEINNNKIYFALMTKKHYRESFFILSEGNGPGFLKGSLSFSANLKSVIDLFKNKSHIEKSSVIFNHGFCCSTLLSRLLEESFNVLSLKEPPLLNSLRHHLENNDDDKDITNTILAIHDRSFSKNQRVLWKPSDYAFDLIDITQQQDVPTVYLYSPLREYIASCSKEKRREWIAQRANYKKIINLFNLNNSNIDISKTSIQATLYWCSFAQKFINLSSNKNNIVAVNSKTLLDNPKISYKIGKHLKLKRKFNIFEKSNINSLLNTYAKTDTYEFNKEQRDDQLNLIIDKNLDDIIEAEKFAEEILGMSIKNFKFKNEIF